MLFGKITGYIRSIVEVVGWIQILHGCGVVFVVGATIVMFIREFFKHLDSTGLAMVIIGVFGVLLIGLGYFLGWQRDRSVKHIPDLLQKMDEKMKRLIAVSASPPEEQMKALMKDIGDFWNIDTERIKSAVLSNDRATVRSMVDEYEKRGYPYPSSPQPFAMLLDMLMNLGTLMENNQVGINRVKDASYIAMEGQLKELQKRLKTHRSTSMINRYLMWWNAQNTFLLFMHHYSDNTSYPDLIPAKMKVVFPRIQHFISLAVDEYLGYVRDSIYGSKDKSKVKDNVDDKSPSGSLQIL